MQSINVFSDVDCSNPVYVEVTTATSTCLPADCTSAVSATNGYYYYTTTTCPSDGFSGAAQVFGRLNYLLARVYLDTDCLTPYSHHAFLASGECDVSGGETFVMATLFSNGSAKLETFVDSTCSISTDQNYISRDILTNHTCYNGIRFYASTGGSIDNDSSGASSVGVIAGIVVGCLFLLLLAIAIAYYYWRRRRTRNHEQALVHVPSPAMYPHDEVVTPTAPYQELPATSAKDTTETQTVSSSGESSTSKLWDDEAIIAARIPREKVLIDRLINRGGFGEVYAGMYNGQRVAVKMLLPERKKSLTQVNTFLSEVKLMATLDHPHIVHFIGVAWDSLADVCVVTEFMAIDLKDLLRKFEEQRLPVGFDHDKVKVALHVAHALTYLHSCAPPVIHRDLKSSNILLNEALDAKVTDFGISRERVDATMTAGVGTSLWMAPEVMMGERYDDKADMFSFGVVLSELDNHSTPYAFAKSHSKSGQKVPDAAILQKVAMGKLRIQFSDNEPRSMRELGIACVSLDPKERPTAAEALYRLQKVLVNEV